VLEQVVPPVLVLERVLVLALVLVVVQERVFPPPCQRTLSQNTSRSYS
jgi:hypothetical protein